MCDPPPGDLKKQLAAVSTKLKEKEEELKQTRETTKSGSIVIV